MAEPSLLYRPRIICLCSCGTHRVTRHVVKRATVQCDTVFALQQQSSQRVGGGQNGRVDVLGNRIV